MPNHDYDCAGAFAEQWNNPPAPFNPEYCPKAKERFSQVTASMEADNFYSTHSREECRIEWRRRYEEVEFNQES